MRPAKHPASVDVSRSSLALTDEVFQERTFFPSALQYILVN